MTVTPPPAFRNGSSTRRVTVVLPGERELIWLSDTSALTTWEVGHVVVFRNCQWRVLARRAEEAEAFTVTLGPVETHETFSGAVRG